MTSLMPAGILAAPAPSITSQPQNRTNLLGTNATFIVVASGQTPLFYHWSFNGTKLTNSMRIHGTTNATLTISNVVAGDAGNYRVVVTNSHGSATSSNATLTVLIPAAISNQPTSQSVFLGGNSTFAATAVGTGPLNYQWYFSGAPLTDAGSISGAITPSLTVSNVQLIDGGGYFVIVSNFINTVTSLTATLTPVLVTHFVNWNSTNPTPPYADWSTAATTIQDAIDIANSGETVLVSDGVYNTGGLSVDGVTTNRVAVTKALTVQSANGPVVTVIQGYQVPGAIPYDISSVRCVYLTNGAALIGFTLTHGSAPDSGGGVWCADSSCIISNCVLTRNFAGGGYYFAGGGGAYGGTLNNCTLIGNSAVNPMGFAQVWGGGANYSILNNCILSGNDSVHGGGANSCILNNCLLTRNRADGFPEGGQGRGGGADQSVLNNCTIIANMDQTSNTTSAGGVGCTLTNCIAYDHFDSSTLNYCCTTPLPSGAGNFTNAPNFVNSAAGNYRLQTNSPCINAGNNAYVTSSTDLDRRPRVVGSAVDIGAYEFQGAGMGEFIGWLQQYGLLTDGSADYADSDGTGMNNWQKWIAGLNPTNPASVLAMLPPVATNNSPGVTVSWQSVTNRTYYLQRSSNLSAQPAFSSIQSNIVGQAGTTSYTDTTATNGGPYFYRVGVQ
jgi:hypothetical protein